MFVEHTRILELYLTERLSVQQISQKVNISHYRINKILSTNGVQKRSVSEAITCHGITRFGLKEFTQKQNLSHEDKLLKVAGIMLYWGEGYKRGNVVALSNSDPQIINTFLLFLRRICGVSEDRLHITVHLYEDHDPELVQDFWSSKTGIPRTQFYKPYVHTKKKGTYREISRYGTVSLQYADRKLFVLILSWISEYYESISSPHTG